MLVEDMNHEFKRQYTKDIIKTVIAFANSSGGKIFIGVDDSGDAIGITNPDEELLQITNAVRDGIRPDITPFTTASYSEVSERKIIVFEVQKGTACPYYLASKGIRPEGVYMRQGASSVPASQAKIINMIKETDGDSYEELRSLKQDLTFDSMHKEFDRADLKIEEPQMRTLGMIREDGLYTNLGLLLSDQCQHSIKAAVFEGTTKNQFRDRYEFDGSVMKQMREVYAFIDRYNRTKSNVIGLDRIDIRDYPESALREALLNSIVHKDYGYGSSTLISIFDDRIEILTVGGLVKGLTKDDIMIGTSILRNKKLANVFYRLKWIEAYGTGIIKMNEAYKESSQHPIIEITDNAFKVTLPSMTLTENSDIAEVSLNASETKIIEMLHNYGQIKRVDVQEELEISQPMAVKLLKSLLDKGVIIRLGSGKNITYKKPNDFESTGIYRR